MNKVKVAIVDDHQLVTKALERMLSGYEDLDVTHTSSNGDAFLSQLQSGNIDPEVVLMDVNMPVKNGVETTLEVTKNFPNVKVIALTMEDSEATIIQMLNAGAKGYLLKDMHPDTLVDAIKIVSKDGTFYTDVVTQKLLKIKAEKKVNDDILSQLKESEIEFMKLACSELTYKEIADRMNLSPRTIDGYRDSVFLKLNVKSRVGIVLFVLNNKLL